MEDTFRDINVDLSLYQNMISLNIKLMADLTALAALLVKNPGQFSNRPDQPNIIRDSLVKLSDPVKIMGSPELFLNIDLKVENNKTDELGQLLIWIYTDIQLLSKGLEMAHETDLFTRYTRLT